MHYSIYYFFLNFSKKYRLPINIDIFYIGSRYFYFILFFSLYHLILRNKYREGIGSFELFSLRYRNVFIRNNVLNLSACFNHGILHQNAVLYFCSLGYLDTTEQNAVFVSPSITQPSATITFFAFDPLI